MGEYQPIMEASLDRGQVSEDLGRVTVLEALAEETTSVSLDESRQSTQNGAGVDFEDD